MVLNRIIGTLSGLLLSSATSPELPNCNERARSGPFEIRTFLYQSGWKSISISYRIPRRDVFPRVSGSWADGPSISVEYQPPLSRERYLSLRFYNFARIFSEPRFTIRAMTMRCGRDVVLQGDVARQPFPLTGVFDRESYLRSNECIAALRRDGSYRLSFEEVQGEGRVVRIDGRADFAAAMHRAERMLRGGDSRARSGRCTLDPPIPPMQ